MAFLTRDQILNADDVKTKEVKVPEWGGSVVVRAMSGKERDAFEESVIEIKNGHKSTKLDNFRAKLVQKTVIDPETKELMFSAADIEALGRKSAAALDRVFSTAQKLNGLSPSDVEELEKN